ncbi:NAD(+) diphosphatase [Aeromicrobium alkaliterrae]|uniref:NAD(+) diphosphatase n=2 Tax=Aeromicrobium alkaliterrae TaxID=302168 RepID=A0ABP4VXW2_9ACTN
MVLGGEHVGTVDGPGLAWLPAAEAPEGEWVWLGEQGGRRHAAVVVEGRVAPELNPTSVRLLAPQLDPDELSLAVHAVAIARWLAATPFCPRCGARTEVQQSGHLRHCPECGASHFPRTDPAVIMLITDDQDRALLGRNPAWPEGRFSTLAGFVEPGESLEDAVRREVREEVGVTVGEVTYGASQPWPFPASLMLGFFGKATEATITVDRDEIAEAAWVTREELVRYGEAGTLLLPPSGVSISSWLIEAWLGKDLTASWY